MTALGVAPNDLAQRARRIGEGIAGPAADDVDRQARFPTETIEALKSEGILGALVPPELGGWGSSLTEAGDTVFAIGLHCASSAMILAMHHLQVACLARHGRNHLLRDFQRDVVERQLLLASATTEAGVGGKLRTSLCAVERDGDLVSLTKQAPVISYGAQADAVLVTARRTAESPPSDQVLVLCRPPGLVLEQMSEWDTLGFRGTCSPGFMLEARGPADQVLSDPFADIAAQTMLPVSHILWGHVWLGLAASALTRARSYVQGEARKQPGVAPPGALRLAEAMTLYQQMESLVHEAAHRYDRRPAGEPVGMGDAVALNSLKVGASSLLIDIVSRSLSICGMAGYREGSPYSLGRHLRDAHGAALMVNNDRILGDNAQMLLVYKEQP
ncbi:MAG: acyl-CoA dehydrogenase family protein [Acidimicrobiales bacterium]